MFYIFADVYLSINDVIIPNHGYVIINDIGSIDYNALICNTNRTVINFETRHSGGNWYGPSGTKVGGIGSDDVPGFVRTRGPMVVRLLRNTATDPPSEGIYHCVVEDDTMTEHTLYVGLYNSGGGKLVLICIYRHFPCFPFLGDIKIPGNISFTLDSASNEANPQFTLTCISTGGPATTVTWTNPDSEVATTGNMTELTDTETAQYTHTLNAVGRLGGLYTCTAENNKPSFDSVHLNIKGAE